MITKFRAWDKNDEVMRGWKELILTKDKNDMFYMIGYEENEALTSFDHEQELMQATGLQDKNGKTYYEGDLVKWDDEIFQVKFDKYQFVLEGFYEPRQDVPYDFFSEGAYKDAEIVGNIYENPNLLEGEK